MVALTTEARHMPTMTDASKKKFRTDVQGLRAVAVGVVLLYHAGLPFIPGGYVGVDVFFVISGFLITGLLLKELDTTGRISLSGFYARRARRILPAGLIVLAATGLMTLAFLPRTRWDEVGAQIVGAAFNVVNWVFAGSEADYLQAGSAASPVQHFWTLAVEEQFYIVWPLLLVAAAFIARPRRRRVQPGIRAWPSARRLRWLVILAVLVISVPSLAFSIYYTATDPGPAYFVTTTRLYELGIGAIVAVFSAQLARIRTLITVPLGWIGLACIIASALLYSETTAFPGAAALLPTLGSAAVIVAGMGGRDRLGVGRLLSTRPMTWVGDISYSLYLWHWPLVVIVGHIAGGLSLPLGLTVIAFSFLPAYLSYRYVERPFMKWSFVESTTKALQVGLIGMLAVALIGMTPLMTPPPVTYAPSATVATVEDASGEHEEMQLFGAAALEVDPSVGLVENADGRFQPSAENAASDNPRVYSDGCHATNNETEAMECSYGSESSDFTVAVVGDSHAAQWVPAVAEISNERQIHLSSFTKSECPLSTEAPLSSETLTDDSDCLQWGENVIQELKESKPDLVLLSSSRYLVADGSFSEGLAGAWEQLSDAGLEIAVIMDTPSPGLEVPDCVAQNADSLVECSVSRDEALDNSGRAAQAEALDSLQGTPAIDLAPYICPEEVCSPVVGGILVYRDSNHMTATYSETLASALDAALVEEGLLDEVTEEG
ncbi:acyltransferase [Citricoccus nitrophenolicus]